MATMLKDVAEGSIVKINEGGVPVEFYVAQHNYTCDASTAPSNLTLLLRKEPHSKVQWSPATGVRGYVNSYLCWWMENVYKNQLDKDIQNAIPAVTIECSNGIYNVERPSLRIFALSCQELGLHNTYNEHSKEGITIPIVNDIIGVSEGCSYWTRSQFYSTNSISVWGDTALDVYLSTNSYRWTTANVTVTDTNVYARPAFCLENDSVFVFDDGTIALDAPLIVGKNLILEQQSTTIDFNYDVTSLHDSDVMIVESLDGIPIRTFTTTSGHQTSTFKTRKLNDGTHVFEVIAQDTSGGVVATKTFTITIPTVEISDGGTIQELQDADGQPVFPLTIGKAVIMVSGKSVDEEMYSHGHSASDVTEGTFSGIVSAHDNEEYTTPQIRNCTVCQGSPTYLVNGAFAIVYT